jgi:hypothetical protein
MLDGSLQRGFTTERLKGLDDGRIKWDQNGAYIMSLSESTKVYFDDFYSFLQRTYEKAKADRAYLDSRLTTITVDHEETVAYYRARGVIVDLLLRTIRRFYCDGTNFGVVMTPWCFGTVVLEKVEVYRDRISRGEVDDPNIADYPYYVVEYINEIYKATLLELFDFPEKAFQMRWQYSELLKRYSKILSNISSSLQSVLVTIKNYGS